MWGAGERRGPPTGRPLTGEEVKLTFLQVLRDCQRLGERLARDVFLLVLQWVWIIQWWCWGMACMAIYIRKARRVVFKSQFQALCKCICWFTSNSNRSNLQVNCDSDSWHWTASETSRATQSINQQTNRASDPHLTITKHQSRNQRLMRAFQLTNTTLTHNVHCNSHYMERQCQKIHRYLLKSNKATDARL